MKRLVIGHLYPREMNIYGDYGNVLALVRRLEWRGFEPVVKAIEIGEDFDVSDIDILFGGGGQDRGQLIVEKDLLAKGEAIRGAAQDGMPMLLVCGLYQLFGRGYSTLDGQELKGIGVFSCSTRGGTRRMIGNIVVNSPWGRLVGFENHSGVTLLEESQAALCRVRKGYGNSPDVRQEGAITGNAIGTYLHGPILPKNPSLADHLILQAAKRRYGISELSRIDDVLELAAQEVAARRPQ